MEYYEPKNAYNNIADWTRLQGYTHPTDAHIVPRRDLNFRYVTVENSSFRPIGIGIATYACGGSTPQMVSVLQPGEIKHLGINTVGGPMQFLYLLDPVTQKEVGHPSDFRTDANEFVLRDGLQNWYVQSFKRPTYRAAK
jgi:hypothetical protein